jgi:hypothetical protein
MQQADWLLRGLIFEPKNGGRMLQCFLYVILTKKHQVDKSHQVTLQLKPFSTA